MALCAITGASGFLGGYLAEQLVQRGDQVRALVRPSSDTSVLRPLGVELIQGDLHNTQAIQQLAEDAAVVYHCAARLGDWGKYQQFYEGTVLTTRNVVQVCQQFNTPRLLHVSSVAAYGHPAPQSEPMTEELPLGQNLWLWDHYARAKMEAEREVTRLGGRATIVRPTWIYGPRDRVILPRIIDALHKRKLRLIGSGDNLLNMVYVTDVAHGAMLAANHDAAGGRVYNLTSSGQITQRQFFATLCQALDLPPVERSVPQRLAHAFGFVCETAGRAWGQPRPPRITRHGISLISRSANFSSQRARDELGWEPQVPVEEGLQRTVAWTRERMKNEG